MPTKTDRILSYLPGTFRANLPVTGLPSALYAYADTFGGELQQAENKLAEIMLSHWVDTADRNAELIEDLAKIAALYGLAPRPDEEVEEFREHLKRYVRTFLEGTITVQGILRVSAEALGLTIADDHKDLDTWWKRSEPELVEVLPDGENAAELVLGLPFAQVEGQPARSARLEGIVDLRQEVNLRGASILRLQVDELATQTIQLVGPGEDPRHVTLEMILARINAAFQPLLGKAVAFELRGHLLIQSPTTGPSSRLEFEEGDEDASMRVLGLRPLAYFGTSAAPASLVGQVDLSGDLDLQAARYLRLTVDGSRTAEVDCGGATPGHRTVEEVSEAINTALGLPVAEVVEEEGKKFLSLTSPTAGNSSSVAVQSAAAQDAADRLLGPHAPVSLGHDDTPATVSSRELEPEVDLSLRYNLRISLDDAAARTINCAGLRPASTTLEEVANAINAALGVDVARRVASRIVLTSGTRGAGSQIRFETPDEADATELLFGLPPRTRRGAAPTSARLVGKAELDEVNLMARHLLRLRVDGGPPVIVDLRRGVTRPGFRPGKAILADLVEAVRAALGPDTASDDGLHLILSSPTLGGGSSVELLPLEVEERRRFVSRAVITGEASGALFGFHWRTAYGLPAVNARLRGSVDLSHGVDLRPARYLRLGLDGRDAVDIDCAGPRPRATLLEEVIAKINGALRTKYLLDADVAFSDGRHLILASPTVGLSSQIRLEPPRAQDALDLLLGVPASTVFGADASGVRLVGIPDLSGGIDLPAHAALKIALDGNPAVEIPLTEDTPGHLSLTDLVVAVSLKLGSGVASQDGHHLLLASPGTGAAAQLVFESPAGADATLAVLGFTPPRSYQGSDARAAQLRGTIDLSADQDLRVTRFLRIGVDARPPQDIDCARTAPPAPPVPPGEEPPPGPAAQTRLQDIADNINAALKVDVASAEGSHLKLTSPTQGVSSRIIVEHYTGGDARSALLGNVPEVTNGEDPQPASLVGEAGIVQPFDLSQRSVLRISVDGGRPREIDVGGVAASMTFLDEVAAKIEETFPGLASITDDDRLQLTSPTAGENSSVAVLPVRTIDLLEYPAEEVQMPPVSVRHGTGFSVMNRGAADAAATFLLSAPGGSSGASLYNLATNWRVQLLSTLRPGESARIWADPQRGLLASLTSAAGQTEPVPPDQIVSAPAGSRAPVPFAGDWLFTGSSVGPAQLLLDNALARSIVELRSLRPGQNQPEISASVVEAQAGSMPIHPGDGSSARLVGRLRQDPTSFWLEGQGGRLLARLRNGLEGGLEPYLGKMIAATGALFAPALAGDPHLLIAQRVDRLFDVTIQSLPPGGSAVLEPYPSVTIGGAIDDDSLVSQVNSGAKQSKWVRARSLDKAGALHLPRGRSLWRFLDCDPDRYNQDSFDRAYFAGGACSERGIFDISRFSYSPPEGSQAVFASSAPSTDPQVEVGLTWVEHRPGAFQVILPADLPEKFGGRFNRGRFGRRSAQPEVYDNVVTEPVTDEDHIVRRLNAESELVQAKIVERVPLGWSPVAMPFRKPRLLTLGSEETPARIYLTEEGIDGALEIRARSEGDWGNAISISARKAGPALFEVTVAYTGAVFEMARQIVSGPDLPDLVLDVLKPAPVGVLLAKAAGIRTSVTRVGTA